jgi:hypothetical protein
MNWCLIDLTRVQYRLGCSDVIDDYSVVDSVASVAAVVVVVFVAVVRWIILSYPYHSLHQQAGKPISP